MIFEIISDVLTSVFCVICQVLNLHFQFLRSYMWRMAVLKCYCHFGC